MTRKEALATHSQVSSLGKKIDGPGKLVKPATGEVESAFDGI